MKNKRGALVVFSGPSGSGKGTILGRVLQERDDTVVSVSATTRLPRTGEVDGVHYFFKTREQFESMIAGDELLEWAEVHGNFYATPREPAPQRPIRRPRRGPCRSTRRAGRASPSVRSAWGWPA